MELEGIKNFKDDGNSMSFTLCRTCRTCPEVFISQDSDEVTLGSEVEGVSVWTKESFTDFVAVVKEGAFDKYLENDNKTTKG